jgi:UDP-N-acetylglucosamine 3-dehydrogenase
MDAGTRGRTSDSEVSGELRFGVVGLGFGANHARILGEMPGVRLVAVADRDAERLVQFATAGVGTYEDHASMLRSERLDAVVVAVPAGQHSKVSLAAIEAGCALLVEKPLAPAYDEAMRIVEAAERRGVALMPGHIERFNPALQELVRRVQAGEIGRVLQLSARRMSSTRAGVHGSRLPPTDVNVVHDSAIHDIDAIRAVLGLEVESVQAVAQSGIVTLSEDGISALLRFSSPDGRVGVRSTAPEALHTRGGVGETPNAILDVNWLSPHRVRELSVLGEHGMFLLDYAAQTLMLHRQGEDAHSIPVTPAPRAELKAELRAFVDSLHEVATLPVSARDGLIAVAVADAITQSARTGKMVHVEAMQ